jgi:hypothetical protein
LYKIELTVSGVGACELVIERLNEWGYTSTHKNDGTVARITARGSHDLEQGRLRQLIDALIAVGAGIYGFSVVAEPAPDSE